MNKYKILIVDGPCSYYYDEHIIADSESSAISIVRNKLESGEGTLYAKLIEENYNPYIKKYQSIPFEAFLLAPDMSNWREACVFIGDNSDYSDPEFDTPPEFLDIPTEDGWDYGLPNHFICKDHKGNFEVWPYESFIETFEEIVD
jgi:hypothetical protein